MSTLIPEQVPPDYPTERPLGRDTDATVLHWEAIKTLIPVAPRLFEGTAPSKSLPLWRFRNPRVRAQLIGCCVGESGAETAETNHNIVHSTEFGNAINVSALWTYWQARAYSAAHGVRLGGEGAIVSHAALAAKEGGFVKYDTYPSTQGNYRGYSDRKSNVPQECFSEAPTHHITDLGLLTSADQILEALAANRTVWIGISIPQGFMRTDSSGRFGWNGITVGGHGVELLAYDQSTNECWIGNSWPQWGMKSTDAIWAPCQGYMNIGVGPLDGLMAKFSDRNMRSGESEAVVVRTYDEGSWAPRKLDDLFMEMYGAD